MNNILRSKDIEIEGKVSLKVSSDGKFINMTDKLIKQREDVEREILEAKEEYEKVMIEIENQRKNILEEAKSIEKKAYEQGYEQGLKNGYEDGFKESYEKNISKAIKESEKIKEDGYNTLLSIEGQVSSYMKENKEYILQTSIAIAEQVLREKFEETNAMNNLLENTIREYNLKKDLILKVNPIYSEELQKSISDMINKFDLSQKIFVVPDSNIGKGNVEIQTKGGKLIVGLDSVLDKVKAELL